MKIKKNLEEDIVKEVLDDFSERQSARKSFDTTWQMNMNFLMGNQYCNVGYGGVVEDLEKQYFWQEREIFNHIAPIFDIRFAKLSKIKPKWNVMPATNDDKDIKTAKVSKKILSSLYNKLDLNEKINQALKWSEVCGTSFYKISWNAQTGQVVGMVGSDNEKQLRSGEIDVSVCSPFEIFPDSVAAQSLKECQSIIHAKAFSITEIKDKFGVDVEGESISTFTLDNTYSGVGGLGYYGNATKLSQSKKENSALVIERYVRPCSEYPNGRLTIVAGRKLVYDDELPYTCGIDSQRDFPFIRQVCIEQPGSFWGVSLIERLIPVQRSYNAVKNRKHEFINRLSLGILSVEDGSVDIENLEDEGLCPGKILVYRQGSSSPSYLSTESIPSGISDEEEKLLDEFTKISGVNEVLDTAYVSSNLSGIALELMIGQDEVRISATSESLKTAIKIMGQYILRLYKQFAIFPRIARIVGDNGQIDMFYFSSSDISSDDILIEGNNENNDTMTQKRQMVFDLLNAGILSEEDGKISKRMKVRILEMLGFGNWDSALDINELQSRKADEENLKMVDGLSVKTSEIDDDSIHLNDHVAFMLGSDYENFKAKNKKIEDIFLSHIREHKKNINSTKIEGE